MTGYRLLVFECPRPGCDQRRHEIHYDAANLPACPVHGEQMALAAP